MFEGCIYVDPIDFGAVACADGNTEVKAVGMVANSTLNGMLHPTVNITATLLGCCTEENCRVDDGVTSKYLTTKNTTYTYAHLIG